MSTWKLTKKLKETHLSPFQKNSSSSSQSSSTTTATPTPQPPTESGSGDTLNLPSVSTNASSSTNSSAGPSSRSGTLSNGSQAHHSKNASKTLTNDSPFYMQQQPDNDQKPQPARIPAPTSSENDRSGPTTSTITPGLLTVSIGSAQGLSLPPSHQGNHERTASAAAAAASSAVPSSNSSSPRKPAAKKRPPVYIVLDYDKTQVILEATSGTIDSPVWDKIQNFDVSRAENLSIQIFTRVPTSHTSSGSLSESFSVNSGTPMSVGSGMAGRSRRKYEDVFLGSCKVGVVESKASIVDGCLALTSGSGQLELKVDFTKNDKKHLTIDDFDLLKVIGKGSFGKVMQVKKRDTHRIYALKTIRKAHIVSRSEVTHTLAERTVLAQIDNPFIVPLKFSFQSPEKLYLVLAFVNGGELFHHLQREGRFDLNRSRFYTAELLCALECLHEYNVIYRDLKPENILLDYTGHIALCDFGLCKLNMAGQEKTNTFCGTPEYLAPELLLGHGYSKVVDWWTLGVLFYEMLTGLPPFYDQDTNEMYRKILQDPLRFPDDMDREARSLLTGLLDRDPKRRLGVNGAADIKAHPFFAQIDWRRLMAKKYAAPFKPAVESATDTSNFDQEFTSEEPTDSVVDKDFFLSESVQQQFGGWTYTNNDSKLASSSGRW